MRIKMFSLLSIFLISTAAFAANKKLNNYEAIKDKLINGESVKVTIDFIQDCSLIKGESINNSRSDSSEIFGMTINKYVIKNKTKNIETTTNFLNEADMSPFGVAAYNIAAVSISPDNSILVNIIVMSVPKYKTLQLSHYQCKMSTSDNISGVKFFSN